MIAHTAAQSKDTSIPPSVSGRGLLLQRKCACGTHTMGGGQCADCARKKNVLQRKFAVGVSRDPLEQEADRIADQVMAGPALSYVNAVSSRIQRFSGHAPGQADFAPASVDRVLSGSGRPLEPALQHEMGQRFGHDFSQVRVHTDAKSSESVQAVNALAYTVGRDIVFASNQFAPDSSAGRQLLAHELTHVIQQGAGVSSMQPRLRIGQLGDSAEREADTVSTHVMRGEPIPSITQHAPHLSRRAIHTGRILNEGSCEHLACNSRWACQDDTNGVVCPDGTRNATSTTGHRYRPLFTCDTKCENNRTCGADEHYMAIPHSRFLRSKCAQDLVICANGSFTHASVRDRSNVEAWEVAPGVLSTLGITSGDITDGTIYPDESDLDFAADTRCRRATPDAGTGTPAPGAETPDGGSYVPDADLEEK